MKFVKNYDSYKYNKRNNKKVTNKLTEEIKKTSEETKIVNESAMLVGDVYKVNVIVDVPVKFLKQYSKKELESTGNDLSGFFGEANLAEELVKGVLNRGMDIDAIPAGLLTGSPVETQTQVQGQDFAQGQIQAQPQVQVQPQTQIQGQAQMQGQGQAQMQGQAQNQDDFEDPNFNEDDNEELPI